MSEPCRRVVLDRVWVILAGVALLGAGPQSDECEITLLNFHRGVYKGGSRHYVFWKARGERMGPRPISIDISRDGGAAWQTVAEGLPNTGRYLWSLPRQDGSTYRLRVTLQEEGGRKISAGSSGDFGIDSEAPDLVPYCKSPNETICPLSSEKAEIRFDRPTDPGPAPVTHLEVWATIDGGITWRRIASGRPTDLAIPIRVTPGETGIILVAQDAAGNRDDTPAGGSEPELRLLWKMGEAPPEPRLVGIEAGKTYRGGQVVKLRWAPDPVYKGSSARVEILLDGKKEWSLLVEGLPWKGAANITLPDNINSASTKLRVYVPPVEEDVEPWEEVEGPFRLETRPPKARVKEIEEE